jgi:hypothetical protein
VTEQVDDTPAPALLSRAGALPEPLVRLLQASRRLEADASGPARREAFRIGRALISGILGVGYSLRAVAAALEISVDSVRGRAQPGAIDTQVLAVLAGVSPDELSARCSTRGVTVVDGRIASDDLVRAIGIE